MYLRSVDIQNFRSCYTTKIAFASDLTLLVGENNAGKSNVIDALRLCTSPSSSRRSRYFEQSDVAIGREGQPIEITMNFDNLTEIQQGQYITALNLSDNTVQYRVQFAVDPDVPHRSKPVYLAGPAKAADVEHEKREQIRHVYLAPLRDAQRELDSGDGARLLRIVETLFDGDRRDKFASEANKKLDELSGHDLVRDTAESIQDNLTKLTEPVRRQQVGISFADMKLHRLIRSLRLKMADHNIDLANLAESGLGYANLLYIATVVLELRHAQDAELTLFLVEEPEAHLHPQLQVALLDYLLDVARESGQDDKIGPAGRIQVIASTHSPNLASSVSIANVVVLKSAKVEIEDAGHHDGLSIAADDERQTLTRNQTVAVPIQLLGLESKPLRKISQYLDVTKAALLFSRTIILVEGTAEAIALPALARNCVFKSDENREQRKRFHSTTVISVDGIDFEPYIDLLLSKHEAVSIVDKLIIITDGDPDLPGLGKSAAESNDTVSIGEEGEGDEEAVDDVDETAAIIYDKRKRKLEDYAKAKGVADNLEVYASTFTFEADLVANPVNHDVLRACYLSQRPKSAKKWAEIIGSENPGEVFYRKLRRNSKYIGKGEFAHDIALALEGGSKFECPQYLREAVESAVRGS